MTKLIAILLMEADFNASNNIIHGVRMMGQARDHNSMLVEIYSKKYRMADNGTLTKTLFFDIAHQARTTAAIASVNASNCYNRIAHAIALLVFQTFGIPESAIESMLGAIDDMKFFLGTGFGDSKRFAGGGVSVKVQGLTQGNGATPSGWAVISIVILRASGKKGHGAKFRCPITILSAYISTILYVDNMDLLHINFDHGKSIDDAHAAIKNSVNSWGNLLIATGGALKPKKCFYLIISFEWVCGEWKYKDNSINGRFGVTVPLPGGSSAAIVHHPVTHAEKILGAMTSPDGTSSGTIQQMQKKAQQWVDAFRNSHLHHRNVCFLLQVQFWPWVGYSLCNSMASYKELENALQRQYYLILPLGGVIRTAPLNCRMVDAIFYCPGLPHPGVKALIVMTNKLLMHFRCRMGLGTYLRMSYSFLLLELGVSFQPLQSSYQ